MKLDDNLVKEIDEILLNIPNNISDLSKIRYIYLKLGKLFNYDFKVIIDSEIGNREINYNRIEKYQTCQQITIILNVILNKFNGNAQTKIIERHLDFKGKNRFIHKANEIIFTDTKTSIKYKLLLDLTLDLYRIDAGIQTKHFGFENDETGSYDIISLFECDEMDKELGFLNNQDEKINKVEENINQSNKPLEDKLQYMWDKLEIKFNGDHEIKQYFEYLLYKIFPNIQFRTIHLYKQNKDNYKFCSLFIINNELYILVNKEKGMIFTNKEKISEMFENNWQTNSRFLKEVLNNKKRGSR